MQQLSITSTRRDLITLLLIMRSGRITKEFKDVSNSNSKSDFNVLGRSDMENVKPKSLFDFQQVLMFQAIIQGFQQKLNKSSRVRIIILSSV